MAGKQKFTRAVLEGTVQGREGLTPFARWASRFGYWPWLALALLAMIVAIIVPSAPAARGALR